MKRRGGRHQAAAAAFPEYLHGRHGIGLCAQRDAQSSDQHHYVG
jgi:hypothetical protein